MSSLRRSSPEQVTAWRRRSKPLKRSNGLKRTTKSRSKMTRAEQEQAIRETRAFKEAGRRQSVCAKCGALAFRVVDGRRVENPWEAHHVITKTFLRREHFELWHPDNALRLCQFPCHEHHTTAFDRLPLTVLLNCNIEYAVRLLGEDGAYSYLTRNYVGQDPRVDALLETTRWVDLEDAA